MRKLIVWLGLAGTVVITVLVVLSLVRAPFDPLRKLKRKFFPKQHTMYEARIQLTLARQLDDLEMEKLLQEENALLDSQEFLAPLVQELGLVAAWKMPDEIQAVARLRDLSELRRGELPTTVVLAARDKEEPAAGRLIEAMGKAYMARKQTVTDDAPLDDEGFKGGF